MITLGRVRVTFSITRHVVNDGVLRLELAGEVVLTSCDQIEEAIRDAVVAGNAAELIIDLGAVGFLDSTGIQVLVTGYRLADSHGTAYWVINAREAVLSVLTIVGVFDRRP